MLVCVCLKYNVVISEIITQLSLTSLIQVREHIGHNGKSKNEEKGVQQMVWI